MNEELMNQVILGDSLVELDRIEDKSINLICIDPPYNIGKDEWDYREDYYEFMNNIFIKLESKLKDNGSFFFFHNDFRMMAELDRLVQKNTSFMFRNFIVWNKRFDGSPKKGFLDGFIVRGGLNSFNKMAEYMMFYTFDNSWKLKEERTKRNVVQMTMGEEILSRTGGLTGWYSNIEMGKNYPTEETIKPITKHLGLTIDDIVPKFRNQKKHHSVWNYDLDAKKVGHITPKPVELMENIILHTTDENDVVLDCFAGAGSTAIACKNLNRNFIMIEREKKYCDIIEKKLDLYTKSVVT